MDVYKITPKLAALSFLIFAFIVSSCNTEKKTEEEKQPSSEEIVEKPEVPIKIPVFNEDNAFDLVQKQVQFGPRVPSTPSHAKCAIWLVNTLKNYTPHVSVQSASIQTFDGKTHTLKNIIAQFNPTEKRRILLSAHWDTRPFADQDSKNQGKPIDGANDGASGVAVLLEIARNLSIDTTRVGVDIILFDIEDYGQPENSLLPEMKDSYCLGSQYWAKNPHVGGYSARFGILLDMVGAPGATFTQEEVSRYYASYRTKSIWNIANNLGYGSYFINKETPAIIDDHYYVNKIINIPMLDIIHRDDKTNSGFGEYWHTHDDNITNVDKKTLKAVGQTVISAIYQE